jgi:hypothetical protein
MKMSEIKSNEDFTKACVEVKRGKCGPFNEFRITKKHAKENGINWKHVENTIQILKLKVKANGFGHVVSRP